MASRGLSGVNKDQLHQRDSCNSSYFPANRNKRGADEWTRTADLLQLRVIHQALQGVAGGCKTRISRRLSLLRIAAYCTVLRSRWYQSGIRSRSMALLRSPCNRD